jgi:hypothetical protein
VCAESTKRFVAVEAMSCGWGFVLRVLRSLAAFGVHRASQSKVLGVGTRCRRAFGFTSKFGFAFLKRGYGWVVRRRIDCIEVEVRVR